jgi:hypothetical protein
MRQRRALFLAGAILAAVGWVGGANAAPVTTSTSPITIDGWTISWPTTVGLAVSQDSTTATQVDLQKTITVSSPGQGFQISFAPGASATADTFVIDTESITNSSGSSFGGFSFILLNTGSVNATFGGTTPGFTPPSGTGYDYTSVLLENNKTELDYVGTQNNGVTSVWGNGDPSSAGDNLVIDAPAGSSFALKELAVPGSSGPPAVPLPASLWQSLIGLTGLGLFAGVRSLKRRGIA